MLRIARCAVATALLIVTVGLTAASAAGSAARTEGAGTARYVVVFDGERAPRDFAERVEALGGTALRVLGDVGVASVGGLTDAAARELRRAPGVRAVEPDLLLAAEDPAEPSPPDLAAAEAAEAALASAAPPTGAEFYPRQWNLRAIGAPDAWAAGYLGSPEVTAFVLDTGIDYLHPDLVGRVDLSRSVSLVSSYS